MVVRYIAPNGSVVSGPPYTEAEEQELYPPHGRRTLDRAAYS